LSLRLRVTLNPNEQVTASRNAFPASEIAKSISREGY
jgi:hypothetical protein